MAAPAVAGVVKAVAGSTSANIDLSSMTDPAGTLLNRITSAASYSTELKEQRNAAEQSQQNFDAQFDEDKRRFGLNYALQNFSMRASMSFQQAQALYQRQAGQVQQGMEYQTFSQGMKEKRKAFQWANEDRATKKKFDAAFTRGLAKGLKTGGK